MSRYLDLHGAAETAFGDDVLGVMYNVGIFLQCLESFTAAAITSSSPLLALALAWELVA